jgi:RHS repeat-associated protein
MRINPRLIPIRTLLRKHPSDLSPADPNLRTEHRGLGPDASSVSLVRDSIRATDYVVRLSLLMWLFLLACSSVNGQIAGGGDDVATPIPGAGHDYIHLLSETVNPANGAVSVNIKLPTPSGRGISLPFSLIYNSGPANHFFADSVGGAYFSPDWGGLFRGGWSNSLPLLTFQNWSYPWAPPPHPNPGYCYYSTGYTFYDSAGSGHALGLATTSPPVQLYDYCSADSSLPDGFTIYNYGADSQVGAAYTFPCGNNPGGTCNSGMPPVDVFDAEGTIYSFAIPDGSGNSNSTPVTYAYWPSSIEDRNGNIITSSVSSQNAPTFTDTVGRTLVSLNNPTNGQYGWGFAPTVIVADGLTYNLNYTTATSSFSMAAQSLTSPGGYKCGYTSISESSQGGPVHVVSTITLPNNQTYTFYYDPTYGLLNEIVYPGGGWVKYTWKPSDTYSEAAAFDVTGSDGTYYQDGCNILYKTPVVGTRQVSFTGGTTPSLTQTFTYSTPTWNGLQWTSKSTTVQTTDNITGKTAQTVYTYQSYTPPLVPNTHQWIASQIAVEQQIQYYDWGNTTNPIRTVAKTWSDPFDMTSQQTTLDNNQTSQITYQYGFGGAVSQKSEYDFGSGGAGALLRKTVTNFQSFPFNPAWPQSVYPPSIQQSTLLASPCQTIVYDGSGSGNPVAETDFLYDGGATVCGTAGTPSVSGVSNLPVGTHDETNYSVTSTAARGNLTTVTRKCLQTAPACTSGNPTTKYTYDETGQVLTSKDANGNTTQYSYADSYTVLSAGQNVSYTPSSSTNAYLTKITDALLHVENFTYDFNNGQLTISKDPNSQPTSYLYNDSLGRLRETDYPGGGKTTTSYNDASPYPSVTSNRLMSSGQSVTSTTTMDGMGHVIKSVLTPDPDCASGDRTDAVYDGTGHVYTISNPYCSTSDPTYGLTTYVYDALGRTKSVTHPDGAAILTSYTGRATQVQDEGNGTQRVTRISQVDGLGRLKYLCEVAPGPFVGSGGTSSTALIGQNGSAAACPLDFSGTGFLTGYLYNTLGDLTQVTQGTMAPRTFNYDSLSRLTSSANPESNTSVLPSVTTVPTTYSYDANGNLSSKTAPAPNQNGTLTVNTNYTYDALNRMTAKSYSDGTTPSSTYLYDSPTGQYGISSTNPVGRLVQATSGCSFTLNSYDVLGRVTFQVQQTPITCDNGYSYYRQSYNYDLLGDLTSFTNGMFQTFTYGYNGVARLFSVTSSVTTNANGSPIPTNLISSAHYNPLGSITLDTLADNESESWAYNNRGWLTSQSSGINSSPDYSLTMNSYAPNGDVLAATDSANGSWNYSYDQFNRLVCANLASNGTCTTPPTGTPNYTYVYDRFGNRWQQNGQIFNTVNFTGNNPGSPANTNRVDGYSYDTAGNLTNDGNYTYGYDAENRLISVVGGSTNSAYTYDALGHRVKKTGDSSGCGYGGNIYYLYDLSDRAVVLFPSGGTNNCKDEVYAGGRHLATYDGGLTFSHADWLGTERVRHTYGYTGSETCASLPFGDNLICNETDPGLSFSPLHFTGKERDPESNLDNFGARYNSSALGRFMTPDPGNAGAVDRDPQSWNAYSYVRNNPLNLTDPTGEVFCRAANDTEKDQGVTQVCDVTDADYVNSSKDQQAAYDKAGYTHFDCSCDTGADKDAWQNRNGNVSNDWIGDALVVGAVLAGMEGIFYPSASSSKERLPQDENVNPNPPSANNGNGTIGTSPSQRAALNKDIADAKADGATDIRVNQQQVNAQGERVGTNRPDLQYTDKEGVRHYIEYERTPNGRGLEHQQRIQANDPAGNTTIKIIP